MVLILSVSRICSSGVFYYIVIVALVFFSFLNYFEFFDRLLLVLGMTVTCSWDPETGDFTTMEDQEFSWWEMLDIVLALMKKGSWGFSKHKYLHHPSILQYYYIFSLLKYNSTINGTTKIYQCNLANRDSIIVEIYSVLMF